MGDADVLAKLSRILETHNVSDPDDESTTLDELLQNIATEGGVTFDDNDQEINGTRGKP